MNRLRQKLRTFRLSEEEKRAFWDKFYSEETHRKERLDYEKLLAQFNYYIQMYEAELRRELVKKNPDIHKLEECKKNVYHWRRRVEDVERAIWQRKMWYESRV